MIKTAIISLVVVVVVLMLASLAGGVFFETPGTSKKNFDNLLSAVNDAKGQSQTAANSVATQLAGLDQKINSAVSTGVAQSTSQLTSQISSVNSKINELNGTVNSLNGQLSSLNSGISSVKSDIATVKQTVDAQNKTLSDFDARIKKLENASLPSTSPPTITSFTPTTGTSGAIVTITGTNFISASTVTFGGTAAASFTVNSATQITATLGGGSSGSVGVSTPAGSTSNGTFTYTGTTPASAVSVSGIGDFTGQPFVAFNSVSANTSTPRLFYFTLNNGTGKPITGVQFLIALQALTSDYQPTDLPVDATIKITSSTLIGTLWQQQPIGGGVFAFTNQVMTGILAGLGAVSQNPGSQQYTISVTVTTTNTPIASVYLYPTVKVLNYN